MHHHHLNHHSTAQLGPPGRRRSISDPLAAALLPPPDETPEERERRVKAEDEAKKRSDNIDKMLREGERQSRRKKSVKVLLLGQSESGKSTTLKRKCFILYNLSRGPRGILCSPDSIYLGDMVSVTPCYAGHFLHRSQREGSAITPGTLVSLFYYLMQSPSLPIIHPNPLLGFNLSLDPVASSEPYSQGLTMGLLWFRTLRIREALKQGNVSTHAVGHTRHSHTQPSTMAGCVVVTIHVPMHKPLYPNITNTIHIP